MIRKATLIAISIFLVSLNPARSTGIDNEIESFIEDINELIRNNYRNKDSLQLAFDQLLTIDHEAIEEGNLHAKFFTAKGYLNVNLNRMFIQGLDDYNKAIFYLKTSTEPDYNVLFNTLNNKGKILRRYNEFNRAIKTYDEAYEILIRNKIKDSKNKESILFYNLGLSYYYSGKLEDALGFLKKSYKLKPQAKKLIYIGLCFKKEGDYNYAITHFSTISDTVKSSRYKGQAFHNLAEIYLKKSDTVKAINYLSKALGLKSGSERFVTLMDLGHLLIGRDPSKSVSTLKEAVQYTNQVDHSPENIKVWWHLYTAQNFLYSNNSGSKYLERYATEMDKYVENQNEIIKRDNNYKLRVVELELERDFQAHSFNKKLGFLSWLVGIATFLLFAFIGYKKWNEYQLIKEAKSIRSSNPTSHQI